MQNRKFLQGILAGGLVGALIGVAATPRRRPGLGNGLLSKTTRAGHRAQKMFREVRKGVQDIRDILD